MNRTLPPLSAGLLLIGLTAACDDRSPERDPIPVIEDEAPPTVSIIRPSVLAEIEEIVEELPDPVEASVMFDYGSAELSDQAHARLDQVLATEGLIEHGGSVTLTGRTDSRGGVKANQRMAKERAEAVRDYLVAGGLSAAQITVIDPKEPNAESADTQSEEDAAAARRVDVVATPPVAEADD